MAMGISMPEGNQEFSTKETARGLKELSKKMSKDLKDLMITLDPEEDSSEPKYWVSTGCSALDYNISNRRNGGLPVGKLITLAGNSASGKSLMAAHICANTQKMGGLPIYIDAEQSFNHDFAGRIGLDTEHNFWYPEAPSSVEDVFTFLFSLGHQIDELEKSGEWPYKFITIVWDSVASSPCKADLTTENPDPTATVGLKPRILSKNFSTFLKMFSKKNILLVCINQLRTNIRAQPFSDPWVEPGGNALPFYSSVRIRLSSIGKLKTEEKETIGVKTQAEVMKTRFGPPHRKCEFPIYFTHGIDDEESILTSVLDKGGIDEYAGGAKGKQLGFKGEPKENAIPRLEFKKKFMTDKDFKKRVLDAFDKVMALDLSDPRLKELSVEAE